MARRRRRATATAGTAVRTTTALAVVVLTAAAAMAGLTTAPAAHAGGSTTVTVADAQIVVTAGPGMNNFFVIQDWGGGTYSVTDFGETPIDLTDPACFRDPADSAVTVRCAVPGLVRIHVSTLDGQDTVNNFSDVALSAAGGEGDDALNLGGAAGTRGWADGGPGDDSFGSGGGDDTLIGGPGDDTAYFGGGGAVVASLATGRATRDTDTDLLRTMENLVGGPYSDTLTGNDYPNVIRGGSGQRCDPIFGCPIQSGDDVISGRGGADVLDGQGDHDEVSGGKGDDQVIGGPGDDLLRGDVGVDTLDGGPGVDRCTIEETVHGCERPIV
jgi:Ca2+-binding RTX toxin-like protein